jgi:sugar lactone lactonase YvrE
MWRRPKEEVMQQPPVTLLDDTACTLGEGPSYDPSTQTLYWFDILEKRLLERRWPDGPTRIHALPEMASAIASVDEGRQLLVTETGLHLRDRRSGELTLHRPIEADDASTRSNDSRVHPSGAFWIGTMGKDAQKEAGAIYWYFRGELRQLYPGITVPNSICFAADGATAFFADSELATIFRVSCDPANGLPRGEPRPFIRLDDGEGVPDGSVMATDGTLWNARWDGGTLDGYDATGNRIARVALPAKRCTCPVFVGPDASRIAVTSASNGITPEQATGRDGMTFLAGIEVAGRFDPPVAL